MSLYPLAWPSFVLPPQMKEDFKGAVVPPEHPASQRVRRIAQNIIHAATQGLDEDERRLHQYEEPKPHPHKYATGHLSSSNE